MKKTIKVIDLLNTPLDKLPKRIKIEDTIYNLYIDEDNLTYYQNEECKYFMYGISCFNSLNYEVEIIEEDEKTKEIEHFELDKDIIVIDENTNLNLVSSVIMIEKKLNEIINIANYLLKKDSEK